MREFEMCERCHCCSAVWETVSYWTCGGFCGPEASYDDDEDDGWCPECEAEGGIAIKVCIGNCDADGKHKRLPIALPATQDEEGEK